MKKLLVLPIILSFLVIFFYKVIFLGKIPIPVDAMVGLYHPFRDVFISQFPRGYPFKNFLITDSIRQQIPWKKIIVEQIKNGILPLRNPSSGLGIPLSANPQSGAFYPFNLIFWAGDLRLTFTLYLLFQSFFAFLFMYLFLRSLRLNKISCLISSFVWSLGGINAMWFTWGNIGHTILYLPLYFYAINALFFKQITKNWYLFLLIVLCDIYILTAGHLQLAFYSITISTIYSIYLFVKSRNFKVFSAIIISFIFGFILSFPILIEQINYLLFSSRTINFNGLLQDGFLIPISHLIQFYIPDFFGNPTTLNYFGEWNYGEMTAYIGLITLISLCISFFVSKIKNRLFFIFTILISLILATKNPVSIQIVKFNVPFFSSMQPTRLLFLIDFSLVVIFAQVMNNLRKYDLGLNKLIRSFIIFIIFGIILFIYNYLSLINFKQNINTISLRNSVVPLILIILTYGLFYLYFTKKIKYKYLIYIVTIIVFFDIFRYFWKFNPQSDAYLFYPKSEILTYLSEYKNSRTLVVEDEILPPNISSYYLVNTLDIYDSTTSKKYFDFINKFNNIDFVENNNFSRFVRAVNYNNKLINTLNVDFVLTFKDISNNQFKLVKQEGLTKLFQNLDNFGIVFIPDTIINRQKDLFNIYKNNLNNEKIAVVNFDYNLKSKYLTESEYLNYTFVNPARIEINSNFETERFVAISVGYDNRWKCKINNKICNIFPVNNVITGVIIPSGKSKTILSYRYL